MKLQRLLLSFVPLAIALSLSTKATASLSSSPGLVFLAIPFWLLWLISLTRGSGRQVVASTAAVTAVQISGWLILSATSRTPGSVSQLVSVFGLSLLVIGPYVAMQAAWGLSRPRPADGRLPKGSEPEPPTRHDD
ncbi:hypothetical protein [Botrimarina sp.]|uniref:hypothetical protein n=1 Tax=Botrimarina sp. TaxID=2795802 RepID=UPI0032EBBFD9